MMHVYTDSDVLILCPVSQNPDRP